MGTAHVSRIEALRQWPSVLRRSLQCVIDQKHRTSSKQGLALSLAWGTIHVRLGSGRAGEAEIYRLKGLLLLKVEGAALARSVVAGMQDAVSPEGCFLTAIEMVRRQEGKSLELRATVSLARLWQQQGKNVEARHMPAAIYGWFTEGFDTIDLQQAKALLEELSASDMVSPDGDQRYG